MKNLPVFRLRKFKGPCRSLESAGPLALVRPLALTYLLTARCRRPRTRCFSRFALSPRLASDRLSGSASRPLRPKASRAPDCVRELRAEDSLISGSRHAPLLLAKAVTKGWPSGRAPRAARQCEAARLREMSLGPTERWAEVEPRRAGQYLGASSLIKGWERLGAAVRVAQWVAFVPRSR